MMGALADVWRRLRSLGRRQELEDRLDDEIRFHVDQQIEKNRRAGMKPDEARRLALIRFGGVEQIRERTRDEFRAARLEHLARYIRYGARSLRRHPAFSAMAVLSLAIGIGANAVIFGVVHTMLLRESPLREPETLVNIYETEAGRASAPMSHPNIEDLRKGTTDVFSGITASTSAVRLNRSRGHGSDGDGRSGDWRRVRAPRHRAISAGPFCPRTMSHAAAIRW